MNMKKLLALLLALVMVLSMAACSDSDEEEEDEDEKVAADKDKDKDEDDEDKEDTIVGTWEAEIDVSDLLNEAMGVSAEEYAEYFEFEDLSFVLRVTYEDDDTYTAEIDEDSVEDMANSVLDSVEDGMIAMIEAEIENQGLDMSVDEFMEKSGVSMDDLMSSMDADSLVEEMIGETTEMSGEYVLEDDKLYMFEDEMDEEEYVIIELDGDSLTFEDLPNTDDMDEDKLAIMEAMFPMEFERVD